MSPIQFLERGSYLEVLLVFLLVPKIDAEKLNFAKNALFFSCALLKRPVPDCIQVIHG